MKFPKDLSGMKFERLTVLKMVEPPENLKDKHSKYWLCKCECGNEKVIVRSGLTMGTSKSCGCIRREMMSEKMKAKKTHGLTGQRFYRIWSNMKRRCQDPKDNQYHNYGARGIAICQSWQTFENFMKDMYQSYIDFEATHGENTASIDRLNSNENYEPSNCKWATQLEQARNRADNISVVINGKEYSTLSQVAEEFNFNYHTILQRYHSGKRDMDLITKPKSIAQKTNKIPSTSIEVEVNGIKYESLTALQKDYPYISLVSISKRYKKGLRNESLILRPQNKQKST